MSNSFILFFPVYFTVIHVQLIFVHAGLASSRARIIPSHNNNNNNNNIYIYIYIYNYFSQASVATVNLHRKIHVITNEDNH